MRLIGVTVTLKIPELPKDRPIIFISNHQSLFDIPLLIWTLREYHPRFIAKRELGKWIPSLSHALRNFGSALIDRKDPKQAISAIEDLGQRAFLDNFGVVIFPEGTRARDGKLKPFKSGGIKALVGKMPGALIVPLVIDGSWELTRYKMKPVPYGVNIRIEALPSFETENHTVDDIITHSHSTIQSSLT